MEKPVIDKYFEQKGIRVRFNTLGHTELLVRSYLKDFQFEVNGAYRRTSEDVKHACYNKLYPVKARPKFTGFETLKKQDNQFRKDINFFITTPQFSPLLTVEHDSDKNIEVSYKTALKESLLNIENPIVYISGGLDSEIVANAFVEIGKKFIPLIYYYVDDYGNLLNKHDIGYAYAFCKKHGLNPVIKQLNVPKLWQTVEFRQLAIDLQIASPQLVTYAYMIQQTDEQYPNHTHVFGGEVRFRSNYQYADRNYNLVFLDKLVPGYNGQTYLSPALLFGGFSTVGLIYYGNSLEAPGTWEVQSYAEGFPQPVTIANGVWTTTPELGPYEVIVTGGTLLFRTGNAWNNYYPQTFPQTIPMIGAGQLICYTEAGINQPLPYGTYSEIQFEWNIDAKVVGEVSPVVSSTIILQSISENT